MHQALWGGCGVDCEFCSGCDNRGGGRIESIYQPYIDGLFSIRTRILDEQEKDTYMDPFILLHPSATSLPWVSWAIASTVR